MRFKSIAIENFKNVEYGQVGFDNPRVSDGSSILALYGQNGSGKSALIDCLAIFKTLFADGGIPDAYAQYIRSGAESARIVYELEGERGPGEDCRIVYEVAFSAKHEGDDLASIMKAYGIEPDDGEKAGSNGVRVLSEALKFRGVNDGRLRTLFASSAENPASPKSLFKSPTKDEEEWASREFAKQSFRRHELGRAGIMIFENDEPDPHGTFVGTDLEFAFNALYGFSNNRLFVAGTKELESIESGELVFYYNGEAVPSDQDNVFGEDIEFALAQEIFALDRDRVTRISTDPGAPSAIRKSEYARVQGTLEGINEVLVKIVPGLRLSLHAEEAPRNRLSAYIQATHGSSVLPLSCESRGIQKLVSIAWLLVGVYNYESFTAVIDELDSGVFEYLLGELLDIIAEEGKGQLIFTSHNLRPLEVLDKGYIAFSTANPKNRYIRLKNVKTTNNLRDFYYRSILLGGQDESVYDPSSEGDIRLAFIKAGRAHDEG